MTNSVQCMQIVFIGSGNLATNLATALKKAGHIIKQVYSRTEKSASILGVLLQCPHTSNIKQIERNADLYIVALKDSVLQKIANEIIKGREGALWVHTSGSTEMDVLNCERSCMPTRPRPSRASCWWAAPVPSPAARVRNCRR